MKGINAAHATTQMRLPAGSQGEEGGERAGRHLGVGEASSRDRQVVEDVGPAADVLHGADALCAGSVRQHVLACTEQPSSCQLISTNKSSYGLRTPRMFITQVT
jgi:hypothetical protein